MLLWSSISLPYCLLLVLGNGTQSHNDVGLATITDRQRYHQKLGSISLFVSGSSACPDQAVGERTCFGKYMIVILIIIYA